MVQSPHHPHSPPLDSLQSDKGRCDAPPLTPSAVLHGQSSQSSPDHADSGTGAEAARYGEHWWDGGTPSTAQPAPLLLAGLVRRRHSPAIPPNAAPRENTDADSHPTSISSGFLSPHPPGSSSDPGVYALISHRTPRQDLLLRSTGVNSP